MYVCFQLVAFVREHVWHKAFLMKYSKKLELTLVSSINDPWLVRLVYIGVVVPLSWNVFTLELQQPSLNIYIYIYIYKVLFSQGAGNRKKSLLLLTQD